MIVSKIINKIARNLQEFSNSIIIFSANLYPCTSLNSLDKKISLLLPELLNSNSFYVEVGANDGIKQSNTFFLERIYKAKGLLIEPSQSQYEKLIQHRSKNNIFENCALVSSDHNTKFLKLEYADLMTIAGSISNIDAKKQLVASKEFTNSRHYSFFARAETLSNLLEKHNVSKVDFMSIDVEGSELSLLKGIDFISHKITNILIETRDFRKVNHYLNYKGYELIEKLSLHDYLFSLSK